MKIREAIAKFLSGREADSPVLIPKWSTALETQVMCSKQGEPTDNPGELTADGETFKDLRWPWQAGTSPQYRDSKEITFSPAKRVERVGSTGWNFQTERSEYIGIDIDSEDGHAPGTTAHSQGEIQRMVERLSDLPYTTLVRSTGGKGLHVYVFFDPGSQPAAANHHEHTIVARKTLELICKDINFDLRSRVDCVGSVFWFWSRSSPAGHSGFGPVKEATEQLDGNRLAAISLPAPAVRGQGSADFEVAELTDEHNRILEAVAAQPFYINYRSDIGLIHAHTRAIADAIDAGLVVKGAFKTASEGNDPDSPNCYLAPQAGGSFRVVRFGPSKHEPTWEFKNGKNYCLLNEEVSFQELVSRASHKRTAGRYELTPSSAAELAESLGEPLGAPAPDDVWAVLCEDGVQLQSKSGGQGWVKDGKVYVKNVRAKQKGDTLDQRLLRKADDNVRFVIQDGSPRGWYHKTDLGEWIFHKSYSELSCVVSNMFAEFADRAHTLMMRNPWSMVRIPFEQEYPGNRRWNYNAPQLAVTPAESGGDHPYFDRILDHVGTDLDTAVMASEWCRKANIQTGADYLRTWLACLIHHTQQPLPYLFLVGPQNSGKSIFHEMTKFLFTGGVTSANSAITSTHNGELDGCFLVYIEERDLADKRIGAYERIKEWVTGRELMIHEKYVTPYMTPNYLHFVHMANNASHLPLEDGDTRIVAVDVPALKAPVPKATLESFLQGEAPRFLRTLLNTVVPPPVDRLRVPALRTGTKDLMERRAMTPVAAFAREKLHAAPGYKIAFEEFYSQFKSYCDSRGVQADPVFCVLQELMLRSDRFTVGVRKKQQYLVNCSFEPPAKTKEPIIVQGNGRF